MNRYAEAFDVAATCLCRQRHREGGTAITPQVQVPIATQTPGTGKTALGCHLVSVLNRPKEGSAEEEEYVFQMLQSSKWLERCIHDGKALADSIFKEYNETLVTRMLRAYVYMHLGGTDSVLEEANSYVDNLKNSKLFVVKCEMIHIDYYEDLFDCIFSTLAWRIDDVYMKKSEYERSFGPCSWSWSMLADYIYAVSYTHLTLPTNREV